MKKLLFWVLLIPNIPSTIVATLILLRANNKKEKPVSDEALSKFLTKRFMRDKWARILSAVLTYNLIYLCFFG